MGKPGGVSFAEESEEEISPGYRLNDDPRWQLVGRIVTSSGFSKSPKLVSFLRFVAQRSLIDPSSQINEQSIGVTVFGRTSGYDSNDDNIVRSHASRLRLKLEAYFQNEGAGELLRISIPKGSYVPTFHESSRTEQPGTSGPAEGLTDRPTELELSPDRDALSSPSLQSAFRRELPEAQATIPTRTAPPNRHWLLTIAACVLCIVATYWLTSSLPFKGVSSGTEANHTLWQELLGGPRNTLIVNGDSSLVIYENTTGKMLSIAEYISGNYRDEIVQQDKIDAHVLRTIARRRLTSIVDLDIANRITNRPELAPNHVVLRYARDLHVDDLKGSNVILIGSQEANPWVQLYSESLNFTIVPDQQTKIFTIRNRAPKAGEATEYQSVPGDPERRAYAVVAFVKNLDGFGRALIIQGTGMAGTEAAADYVLSQGELSSLLHTAFSTSRSLPNFEMLLETSNLNGNAPKSKLVALRVNGR